MYGPVRTVVWQGSAGDRRPYADQTGLEEMPNRVASGIVGGSDIYLSAPSPITQEPEPAICILYIEIVLPSDLLPALT